MATINSLKRDRFELVSAYLDGEVTAAERKQVEEWLATDPVVKRLHKRLLNLRQGLHSMPIPASTQTTDQTANQVFERLDRRPRLRLIWGGGAIAALFVGAFVSSLPWSRSWMPQMAQSPVASPLSVAVAPQSPLLSDGLMIALERPVVAIPKAPVSLPANTLR
ncbi:MAG: Fis family transcriptional regulator [Leptolyngbyaceae bacterium]|nr:Fis family transcriptional regulator [Leptolyngbyaceae bacterium]